MFAGLAIIGGQICFVVQLVEDLAAVAGAQRRTVATVSPHGAAWSGDLTTTTYLNLNIAPCLKINRASC